MNVSTHATKGGLTAVLARAALIIALLAGLLIAVGLNDPAGAQVLGGQPTSTNTQCDWTDDLTGIPTSVTFDVQEFLGVDLAPGANIGGFTYLVNLDNSADPFNPDGNLHPITHPMGSNAPIVATGSDDGDGIETATLAAGCRYLFSVRAAGYKLGSLHIRIEADGSILASDGTPSPLVGAG